MAGSTGGAENGNGDEMPGPEEKGTVPPFGRKPPGTVREGIEQELVHEKRYLHALLCRLRDGPG
jgi:hypothetical protein